MNIAKLKQLFFYQYPEANRKYNRTDIKVSGNLLFAYTNTHVQKYKLMDGIWEFIQVNKI